MFWEQIWELNGELGALSEARRVAPVLEELLRVRGLELVRYDLNGHLNWRGFDVEKVLVDALTQRTQLVRMEGERAGEGCMMAMGKHGEVPTVVVSVCEEVGVEGLLGGWGGVFERTEARRLVLTGSRWRQVVEAQGLSGEEALGYARAWRGESVVGVWDEGRWGRIGGVGWCGVRWLGEV